MRKRERERDKVDYAPKHTKILRNILCVIPWTKLICKLMLDLLFRSRLLIYLTDRRAILKMYFPFEYKIDANDLTLIRHIWASLNAGWVSAVAVNNAIKRNNDTRRIYNILRCFNQKKCDDFFTRALVRCCVSFWHPSMRGPHAFLSFTFRFFSLEKWENSPKNDFVQRMHRWQKLTVKKSLLKPVAACFALRTLRRSRILAHKKNTKD